MNMPSHTEIASIVSSITESMIGLPTAIGAKNPAVGNSVYCCAILPVAGEGGIAIAVSSDLAGVAILGGALFQMNADELDDEMYQDTLAELANMTSGLLKSSLGINHALGLPKTFMGYENLIGKEHWQHFPLAVGDAAMLVSITNNPSIIQEYI